MAYLLHFEAEYGSLSPYVLPGMPCEGAGGILASLDFEVPLFTIFIGFFVSSLKKLRKKIPTSLFRNLCSCVPSSSDSMLLEILTLCIENSAILLMFN